MLKPGTGQNLETAECLIQRLSSFDKYIESLVEEKPSEGSPGTDRLEGKLCDRAVHELEEVGRLPHLVHLACHSGRGGPDSAQLLPDSLFRREDTVVGLNKTHRLSKPIPEDRPPPLNEGCGGTRKYIVACCGMA